MRKDKVVVITGSGMGIGRSLATLSANTGASVVINDINQTRLDQTCDELKDSDRNVLAVQGDVSNYEDCADIIQQAINKYGKIDVLFNNAGLIGLGKLEEMKPEVFRKIIDVNFLGSYYMTKAALPYIRKTSGSIIFTGSLAGIHGIGYHSAYCSSKMALTAMVQSLRIELHAAGVHIGLAYVSFAENDPGKTFLNKDGHFISEPVRTKGKPMTTYDVASVLIRMAEKRKNNVYLGLIGKLSFLINRCFPFILHRVFLNVYRKDYS